EALLVELGIRHLRRRRGPRNAPAAVVAVHVKLHAGPAVAEPGLAVRVLKASLTGSEQLRLGALGDVDLELRTRRRGWRGGGGRRGRERLEERGVPFRLRWAGDARRPVCRAAAPGARPENTRAVSRGDPACLPRAPFERRAFLALVAFVVG